MNINSFLLWDTYPDYLNSVTRTVVDQEELQQTKRNCSTLTTVPLTNLQNKSLQKQKWREKIALET